MEILVKTILHRKDENISEYTSTGCCCIFYGWLECLNLNSCQHLQFSLDQTWQWHHHYVFFRCRKPPPRRQYLSADLGPMGLHHLIVKVKTYQISQQKLWCCNIGVGDTVRILFRVCLHKHLSVPICLMRGRRGKMESWWWAEVSLIFLWGRVTLRSVMFQVDMEDRIKW